VRSNEIGTWELLEVHDFDVAMRFERVAHLRADTAFE
jgi:hypothetical protein